MYKALFFQVNEVGHFKVVKRMEMGKPPPFYLLPMDSTKEVTFGKSKINYPSQRTIHCHRVKIDVDKGIAYYVLTDQK